MVRVVEGMTDRRLHHHMLMADNGLPCRARPQGREIMARGRARRNPTGLSTPAYNPKGKGAGASGLQAHPLGQLMPGRDGQSGMGRFVRLPADQE